MANMKVAFADVFDLLSESLAMAGIDGIEEQCEPLTHGQKVDLVKSTLDVFRQASYRLHDLERCAIPTPRKEISASVRDFFYDRDGRACLVCGATDDLTVDHVVPLNVGGTDDKDNLQTLCMSCNSTKGMLAVDYRVHA